MDFFFFWFFFYRNIYKTLQGCLGYFAHLFIYFRRYNFGIWGGKKRLIQVFSWLMFMVFWLRITREFVRWMIYDVWNPQARFSSFMIQVWNSLQLDEKSNISVINLVNSYSGMAVHMRSVLSLYLYVSILSLVHPCTYSCI